MEKTVRGMALGNSKKRTAYRDRRRAQLQEWSAKLDLWQARARKTKADVKIRYHEGVEELQDSVETMRSRVGDLDRAHGFEVGDLRGVYSVFVAEEDTAGKGRSR